MIVKEGEMSINVQTDQEIDRASARPSVSDETTPCFAPSLKAPSISRGFPTWHFSMMNDDARNQAIFDSIAALDLVDQTVFEIGTGVGLTAMYFAHAGAAHVYTCEMDPQLYALARNTVAQNGLLDRITVIHASSTDYIQSAAFDFSPDVIFTETLDCGVVGEGYMAIARDIAAVARPDTIILPSEIRQYGFLVNAPEIAQLNQVGTADDFDLSHINRFSTKSYFPIRYRMYSSQTLSPVVELRRYDYRRAEPAVPTAVTAYASGRCHGIVSFFHAQFGEAVVLNDTRDNCHWHQAFHPLEPPVDVIAGQSYPLSIEDTGTVRLNLI